MIQQLKKLTPLWLLTLVLFIFAFTGLAVTAQQIEEPDSTPTPLSFVLLTPENEAVIDSNDILFTGEATQNTNIIISNFENDRVFDEIVLIENTVGFEVLDCGNEDFPKPVCYFEFSLDADMFGTAEKRTINVEAISTNSNSGIGVFETRYISIAPTPIFDEEEEVHFAPEPNPPVIVVEEPEDSEDSEEPIFEDDEETYFAPEPNPPVIVVDENDSDEIDSVDENNSYFFNLTGPEDGTVFEFDAENFLLTGRTSYFTSILVTNSLDVTVQQEIVTLENSFAFESLTCDDSFECDFVLSLPIDSFVGEAEKQVVVSAFLNNGESIVESFSFTIAPEELEEEIIPVEEPAEESFIDSFLSLPRSTQIEIALFILDILFRIFIF